MTDAASDQDLLEAIRKNDHQAFECLFNRYWAFLFAIIYRRTNDEEESKDLVQELFVQLWNGRETLYIRTSLKSYLFTAAKNRLFVFFRKQRKQATVTGSLPETVSPALAADHSVLYQEMEQAIDRELGNMPETMRHCFKLSREDGKSIREISGILSLSEQTVKNNISQALKRLRVKLEKQAYLLLIILMLNI